MNHLLQEFGAEPKKILLGHVDGIIVSVLNVAAGLDEAAAVPEARELTRGAGRRDKDVRGLDRAMHDVLQMRYV